MNCEICKDNPRGIRVASGDGYAPCPGKAHNRTPRYIVSLIICSNVERETPAAVSLQIGSTIRHHLEQASGITVIGLPRVTPFALAESWKREDAAASAPRPATPTDRRAKVTEALATLQRCNFEALREGEGRGLTTEQMGEILERELAAAGVLTPPTLAAGGAHD